MCPDESIVSRAKVMSSLADAIGHFFFTRSSSAIFSVSDQCLIALPVFLSLYKSVIIGGYGGDIKIITTLSPYV